MDRVNEKEKGNPKSGFFLSKKLKTEEVNQSRIRQVEKDIGEVISKRE